MTIAICILAFLAFVTFVCAMALINSFNEEAVLVFLALTGLLLFANVVLGIVYLCVR